MFLYLSLLFLFVPLEGDASPISCYNDQGDAVDWFFLYKLPKQHGSRSEPEGLKYLLLQSGGEAWAAGKATMNDSAAAAGRTVGQLYAQKAELEFAYVLYNDQPPEDAGGDRRGGDSGSRGGHTKGVVLLDKTQGFWLIHSTPHFPAARPVGRYFYPDSGLNNGQNFVCVTFPVERFQTVGEQLQINQPHVYDCAVPPSLASLVPALAAVCQKPPPPPPAHVVPQVKPATNRSVTLTSKGGADFVSFAKGASFDNDLYHSWVAPALRSDLLVQFWVRSTGVLPSDCSAGWKVLDITAIQPGPAFRFKATQDHSKWAVSPAPAGQAGEGGGWVCVGDINRNKAEEKRGGGTMCLRDPAVWKAYRTAAVACQDCGGAAASSCPASSAAFLGR